jgi:hypothetical protein
MLDQSAPASTRVRAAESRHLRFEDAAEIEQNRFTVGQQVPAGQVVLGGQVELVALLGKIGQFIVGAEIAGGPYVAVYRYLEGLFGGRGGGGIARSCRSVEDGGPPPAS